MEITRALLGAFELHGQDEGSLRLFNAFHPTNAVHHLVDLVRRCGLRDGEVIEGSGEGIDAADCRDGRKRPAESQDIVAGAWKLVLSRIT